MPIILCVDDFPLFGSSLAHLEPKLELFEVWEIMVRQIIITIIANVINFKQLEPLQEVQLFFPNKIRSHCFVKYNSMRISRDNVCLLIKHFSSSCSVTCETQFCIRRYTWHTIQQMRLCPTESSRIFSEDESSVIRIFSSSQQYDSVR